ncbi:MAG: PIG-L family deacetylase [Vicingus serpentipes]|nr:PIG-L family deacetylase [Vicingus serpentipes]
MRKLLTLLFALSFFCSFSQQQLNSAEIKLALKKLNKLSSVLYIAAHPDDENTRLIAYMANEEMARTAYLSLTRGDGGQNLIGTEKGALMGVLRTQELLEARKIDGGEQFFTRAVDFGYSKTPEETFQKWDKDKVLADVVWTIRKFRPDVIITRFPPTSRAGHGHHTASAILAEEAFDLAGDPKFFPEQLKHVAIWQPKRLFLNVSTWWDKELPEKAKNAPDQYLTIDIGTYNTLLGKSYAEIAAESRTMHKSQGFGTGKERGSKLEYLQLIKGEPFQTSVFDGIDVIWNKIQGGTEIEKLIIEANTNFNAEQPENIVPELLKTYQLINQLPNTVKWKESKLKNIQNIIESCLGLFIEVTTEDYSIAKGNNIQLKSTILNRSNLKLELSSIKIAGNDTIVQVILGNNQPQEYEHNVTTTAFPLSHPYWLNNDYEGLFKVDDQNQIGVPENTAAIPVEYVFKLNGVVFPVHRSVTYKWTDRVKGEIYRPFVVLPKITANIAESVYIFSSDKSKEVRVTLKAHQSNIKGNVALQLPEGWKSEPSSIPYELKEKNEEKIIVFNITSSSKESVGEVSVLLSNVKERVKSLTTIEYDHIPTQTLLPDAKAKLVRLNVAIKGEKIGYIQGAGDEVPVTLEQLGYNVTMLDEASIKNNDLAQFDAIVCGIRAYNTNKYMTTIYNKLMEYVKNGGNYVVQYNTNRGLEEEKIGPYPFKLSRDRVTVEEAKTTYLASEHAILNTPNKITDKDFDNWIQERGLYFPNEWDNNYTPILGWNDPNEEMTKGSLLVASYGKGSFIYTGISFFRELPAGVPGAFKLFANIVSYRK